MKNVLPIYSFEPSPETISKMKEFYSEFKEENPNPYVDIFAKGEGVVVTIFKANGKGHSKVVFQGINAIQEALMWDKDAANMSKPMAKPTVKKPHMMDGSDEVGTGDFFGPICVCASFLESKDLSRLDELGITDSKKMDDKYILSIGAALIKEFPYSQLSLPNEKYNEIHDEFNMNAIKAKMHNACYLNLLKKHKTPYIYQDQFAEPGLYFSYLKKEKEVVRNVVFHTKGESCFPSVALASVIARYSFLRKMADLSKKYQMDIPFGAGEDVNSFAKEFVEKYGKDELDKIVKKNFANYKKLD